MKVTIRKGSHEIGGTCIQLTVGRTSILLDAGLPLSAESQPVDVGQLTVDAALIGHSHQVHYGLMARLPKQTPVYIGKLGKSFIDAAKIFIGEEIEEREYRHFHAWQPFAIGDFTITPYLVDHSAADAYAFLIEAEGKRLFYSGDLRSHGRKGKLFENLLNRPVRDLDLLFLEGTMLHCSNDLFPDEVSVEEKILEIIRRQKNITFLLSSSQNIDRVVSAYRACKKAGKILVIDIYTAWVLEQLRQVTENTPAMDWTEIRVYAKGSQYEKLKAAPEYFGDFSNRLFCRRIMPKDLHETPEAFLYFGKMSTFPFIETFKNAAAPVNVIYSQWLGYLDENHAGYFGSNEIATYRNDPAINFVYAHTSGHATVEDLKKLAEAFNPRMLVPIHTEHGDEYSQLFANEVNMNDGRTSFWPERRMQVEL